MGLSGRKEKQRIGPDPRNLSWADDASKFGQSYLSKFGWDASQGLGAEGDGRTSHIKVHQKLDMMGIGAQHQKDPNGIAWKQNKDFESVLRRLNASMGGQTVGEVEATALGGSFISATPEGKKEKKDKKRKRETEGGEDQDSKKQKAVVVATVSQAVEVAPKLKVLPKHRAHRARNIAAKNRAFNSAAAMSEILGISEATPSTPQSQSSALTTLDEPPTMEKLSVSTKSVADYFKERLLAKSAGKTPAVITAVVNDAGEDEPVSRGGIGSFRSVSGAQPRESEEDAPQTMGLGMSKFGSLMSSAFLAATTTVGLAPPPTDSFPENDDVEDVVPEIKPKDKKKRKGKNKEVVLDSVEVLEKKKGRKEKKEKEKTEGAVTDLVENTKSSKEERKRLRDERKAEKRKSKETT